MTNSGLGFVDGRKARRTRVGTRRRQVPTKFGRASLPFESAPRRAVARHHIHRWVAIHCQSRAASRLVAAELLTFGPHDALLWVISPIFQHQHHAKLHLSTANSLDKLQVADRCDETRANRFHSRCAILGPSPRSRITDLVLLAHFQLCPLDLGRSSPNTQHDLNSHNGSLQPHVIRRPALIAHLVLFQTQSIRRKMNLSL